MTDVKSVGTVNSVAVANGANNKKATPHYPKQSVAAAAVECGIMGAAIGGITTASKNHKALKGFKEMVKSDEFIKATLEEKQGAISALRNIRDHFGSIVAKEGGKCALLGALAGVLSAVICNGVVKGKAEKAQKMQNEIKA